MDLSGATMMNLVLKRYINAKYRFGRVYSVYKRNVYSRGTYIHKDKVNTDMGTKRTKIPQRRKHIGRDGMCMANTGHVQGPNVEF